MRAIIVAGGRGDRLQPITDNIPKPMIEVAGKPILFHIIELFKKYGITEFIITLCYLPESITSYFGNGEKFGVKIDYVFEDLNSPLGTAGAIKSAKKFINETFIVTYADILRELDIKKMLGFHEKKQAFATLNIYKREARGTKSMIIIDKDSQVIRFVERPLLNPVSDDFIWANGSFYIFEPKIFDLIPENQKSDFGSDIFPKLLEIKKTIYGYPTIGYFIDIGNIEKLELARKTFKKYL